MPNLQRLAPILLVALPSPGSAAAAPPAGFADIVVTARKRQEAMDTVPIAIDAFDAATLARHDVRTIEDLRFASPSLYVAPSTFRQDAINVTIRGQQNFPSTGLQFDTSTAVYVDGVYYARPVGLTGTLFDVDSVQVLKGPQGTLVGRNSTGGAILYESRQPGDRLGGSVRTTLGDYGRRELQGALDLPITRTLAARLAGSLSRQTGYLKNLYADPVSGARNATPSLGFRRLAGLASLKWTPDPDFSLLLRARIADERYTGVSYHDLGYFEGTVRAAGNRPSICNIPGTCTGFTDLLDRRIEPYFSDVAARTLNPAPGAYNALLASVARASDAGFWTTDQAVSNRNAGRYDTLSARADAKLGGIDVRLLGAHRRFRNHGESQNRGLPYVTNVFLYRTPAYRASQAELTLNAATFAQRLHWTAGLFYFREASANDGDQLYLFLPGAGSPAPVAGRQITYTDATSNDAANTSYAAFAQATLKLDAATRLTAGARYTIDRRFARLTTRTLRFPATPATTATVRNGIFDPASYTLFGQTYAGITRACALTDAAGILLPPAACNAEVRRTFRKPTVTLALDHDLGRDVLAYATARTGYRAGAINSAAINPSVTVARPERVQDVEIGLKGGFRLGAMPLHATLAAYATRYRDIQIQATLPNVTLASGPGGVACTQGLFDAGQCVGASADAVTLNAHAARIRGLEWMLQARPTARLRLETTGSFLDARYTDYSFSPPPGYLRPTGQIDLSGTRFPLPRWQLSGEATWSLPIDRIGAVPLGEVALSLRTYWQSRFAADLRAFDPAQRTSPYALTNARLAVARIGGRSVEAAMFVNNLFGKRACVPEPQGVLASAPNGSFGVPGTSGVVQCVPLPPRMYGTSLAMAF